MLFHRIRNGIITIIIKNFFTNENKRKHKG